MEISKEHFEAILILLYHSGHYDACGELLEAYKELFHGGSPKPRLTVVPSDDPDAEYH